MRRRSPLLCIVILLSLCGLALSACGGARGSYNPFHGPAHVGNSGHVDTRPLNGK